MPARSTSHVFGPWPWVMLLMMAGGYLRWLRLDAAWAPDELANLYGEVAWRALFDAEAAVNPPLLRVLVNLLAPEPQVIAVGRWLSWLCGVATLPMAFLVGRRVGGDQAGLLTAALWAFHPQHVDMSAQFRSYAPFCLAANWHLDALLRWKEQPTSGRGYEVTASAFLLPWLHYFAIPLLALLALLQIASGRDLIWRYLPAALGILPMSPLVLGESSTRVATPGNAVDTLEPIISLLLHASVQVQSAFAVYVVQLGLGRATPASYMAAVVTATVIAHTAVLGWIDPRRRLLLAGTYATGAAVVLLMQVQYPRNPIALYLLVFVAPLLAAIPSGLYPAPLRWLGAVGVAWVVGNGIPLQLRDQARPDEGGRTFARTWRDWDAVRSGRPIALHPGYGTVMMYHHLTGQHLMTWEGEVPGCADHEGCFIHDGVIFRRAKAPQRQALLVSFEHPADRALIAGCTVLHEEIGLVIADCP